MEAYYITWNNEEYPAFDVTIFKGMVDEQVVTVSNLELNDTLQACMDLPEFTNSAYALDEKIAFYLDDWELRLPEPIIIKILEENLA